MFRAGNPNRPSGQLIAIEVGIRLIVRECGQRLRGIAAWFLAAALGFAGAFAGGCASGASTTLRSEGGAGELRARMAVMAYTSPDKNTADVYMSDLPREALEPDADLSGVAGQFVHMHVFITPSAGSTPIDAGACSVVVRTFVVARGQVGLYGGGAFLNPNSAPGSGPLSGSISGGTCRLLSSTPGFVDRLGPSEFSAKFRVPRNDALAAQLGKRLATMLQLVPSTTAPSATASQ